MEEYKAKFKLEDIVFYRMSYKYNNEERRYIRMIVRCKIIKIHNNYRGFKGTFGYTIMVIDEKNFWYKKRWGHVSESSLRLV